MTADPHIERAVRIAKAIREESSDPVTFPLWKPWAIDMADGIGALAARLEAAERDRDKWHAEFRTEFRTVTELAGELRIARAALAAAQQPPAEGSDG